MIIRTRYELIDYVAARAPSNALRRAMKEGHVDVLGGFTAPGGFPMLIMQATGRGGQQWTVGLEIREEERRYSVKLLDRVPWLHWDGNSTGRRPLIDGDRPKRYAYKRMEVRRHGYETASTEIV